MLEKRANHESKFENLPFVTDIDAEVLHVEKVAEVVEEAHQQARRRQSRVEPHVPLVHVSDEQ